MKELYFKKVLSKFISGSISPNEEAHLEKYDHEMIKKGKNLNSIDKDRVWETLNITISKDRKTKVVPLYRYIAAASIVFLVSIVAFYFISSNQDNSISKIAYISKQTNWGQKLNLTLPDGTKVTLNSGSTIEYPNQFSDSIREIKLVGEAFFDVTHNPNKPFVIKTDDLSTKVLGTSFNVKAYSDYEDIKVTLVTGKVELSNYSKKIILSPSEQAIFKKDNKHIEVKEVNISKYIEWRDGVLQFENSTLEEAFKKLERWYGVKIHFENKQVKECRFSGKFKNETLRNIMDNLVFVKSDIDYEFTDHKNITIKGSCKN